MPSTNASLQLPPRRGSLQDNSEPPTPNTVSSGKPPQPIGQGVQRAQTTAGEVTGRNTPPLQQKDMTEEEGTVSLREHRELRTLPKLREADNLTC